MPQLDLTTYSSQIFWFAICFVTLYLFVARIILPRIAQIINLRKNVIDADLSAVAKLDEEIHQLEISAENLRKIANQNYQSKLEEVTKEAGKKREKMLEEFKEKYEEITKKSRLELVDFVEKSSAKNQTIAQDLAEKIKGRFFINSNN